MGARRFPVRMTWPNFRRKECWVRVDLSAMETELLSLLLIRRGKYVSKEEIIEVLWPDADTQRLATHSAINIIVKALRDKLGLQGNQRKALITVHPALGLMIE